MTEKDKLIQAFKSLDFKELENLLDDNKSYMEVSKNLFISTLKKELGCYSPVGSYNEVIVGICNHCNKGCNAYKFKGENMPSLNLYMEELNGKVTDIYLCNNLIVAKPDDYEWSIQFSFYDDEKIDFKPTAEYSAILLIIQEAITDYNNLESDGVVKLHELVNWHNKYQYLISQLNLNDPFFSVQYKAYQQIDSIFYHINYLVRSYHNYPRAMEAMSDYHQLNSEHDGAIIIWLLSNQEIRITSFIDYSRKENVMISLETDPGLKIDCNNYITSIIFNEIYEKHYNDIMERYKPSKEDFEKSGGEISYSLESYLRFHSQFSELL
jgi:hypothetical protein